MRPIRFLAGALAVMLAMAGCQTQTLPDPNDPKAVGMLAPDVLRNLLQGAATQFFSRVKTGEITDEQARDYLAEYANELLQTVQPDQVDPSKAWEYAEVLMAAKRYDETEKFLEIAVKVAKTQNRRVNDRLRLARIRAMKGNVKEAIELTRSVFDAPPQDKAPILTATYLEIVPAAPKKKHNLELAKLLEEAIQQSTETVVDPQTEGGAKFLAARPYHIRNAWKKIFELYDEIGRADLASEAAKRAMRSPSVPKQT